MKEARRILNVLDTGPRKPNVLRGLVESDEMFERAIGWLFLRGFIVAKGKTSGRTIARNGRRMAGFGTVEIVVGLALVAGLLYGAWAFIESVDAKAYRRGTSETTALWQERLRQEQAAWDKERDELVAAGNARLAELQGTLRKAEENYEIHKRRAADEKRKNDDIAADIRAGRLVLRDPGATATAPTGEACRGQGPADPGAVANGDAAKGRQPGQLSLELTQFLWTEASRADEVIEDLEADLKLAQDTVMAYYKLAGDCHAQR